MFTLGQAVKLDGQTGVVRALRSELREDGSTHEVVTIAYLEGEEPVLRDVDLAKADIAESADAPPQLTPKPVPVTEVTAADFMRRFTVAEWIAARTLADTDKSMAYFFEMLRLVTVVHLEHPSTAQGIGYMQKAGILTAERAAEILRIA